MSFSYDFAIIGGDARLAYMAFFLHMQNASVITYKLSEPGLCPGCPQASSLKEAITSSRCIIGPIPMSRDGITINAVNLQEDLTLSNLQSLLTDGHRLFAGCIPAGLREYAGQHPFFLFDYMQDEGLAIFNTIATAEGVIAEAILHQPVNLHQSRCLILGFGRCAKTLACKLRGMSADIAISARSPRALSEAEACGYSILPLRALPEVISQYKYIFNTVPARILESETLALIRPDTLLLDIAPGGFDPAEAERLGLHSRLSLGLPGKYAPKASAEALLKQTLAVLKQQFPLSG